MIDGLRLAFSGEELSRMLSERADHHRGIAARWQARLDGTRPEGEDDVRLPAHVCEFEVSLHEWRARVLDFLCRHVDAGETYRLAPPDLEFAELLPSVPDCVEQGAHQQRSGLAFEMGQLAKAVSRSSRPRRHAGRH
jgi:hypothetical protein